MMANGKWKMANGNAARRALLTFAIFHLPFAILLCAGCTSAHPTTQPVSATDRQNAAMRDPMGYKPDMSDTNTISGDGGVADYDKKAMRKDIDHVFNP
jgi:hypothetical protein